MKNVIASLLVLISYWAPAQTQDKGWLKNKIHIRVLDCRLAAETKDSITAVVTVEVVNHDTTLLDAYGLFCSSQKHPNALITAHESLTFTFSSGIKKGGFAYSRHCFAFRNWKTGEWTLFDLFLDAVYSIDELKYTGIDPEWDDKGMFLILHSW